jgi:hypothetical protein
VPPDELTLRTNGCRQSIVSGFHRHLRLVAMRRKRVPPVALSLLT